MARRGAAVPDASATLEVDLATGAASITWDGPAGAGRTGDLLADPPRA